MSQKMEVTIDKQTRDVKVFAVFGDTTVERKQILELAAHMNEAYEKVSEAVRKEGTLQ